LPFCAIPEFTKDFSGGLANMSLPYVRSQLQRQIDENFMNFIYRMTNSGFILPSYLHFSRGFAILVILEFSRCQGHKFINHVVLAHKWFYAFMTHPKMRIKAGVYPAIFEFWTEL